MRGEAQAMTTLKLVTAHDLWEMPDDGYKYELVRGELLRMTPPGGWHGQTSVELSWLIRTFLASNPIGRVYVETGFLLASDPDIVRAPDVAFVRTERLPPESEREGYLQLAPDLAVEVVSPGDRAADIEEKVEEYLDAGSRLVWVVYRRGQRVTVHHPDRTARTLREHDTLDGEDVLPGFQVRVGDIFK
jgi:Uma2 family endonuclease